MLWTDFQCLRRMGFAGAVLVLVPAGWSDTAAEEKTWGRVAREAWGSPRPEQVPARDAWRLGEASAAALATGEVVMGSGDSMLPLYPDRTVLVVQRQPLSTLRPGMTVVFIGDRGRPVAHVLVAKTARGWTARGLANTECDRTCVGLKNYVGTVVRAFLPVPANGGTAIAMAQDHDRRPAETGQ